MTQLSARSVVASTLLGTHPPRLPGRLLVAFAEEFGISAGTTRVAMSRMLERGELSRTEDGRYQLSGPLLDRQDRQTAGLAPATIAWNGEWEIHVVRSGGRASARRAALRHAARHLGLREHRDGVWLRPANLDPERLPAARAVLAEQADCFRGAPQTLDPTALASTLFELDEWAATARTLEADVARLAVAIEAGRPPRLDQGFVLSAAVLRHLVADPVLPSPLLPADWPAGSLRDTYAGFDETFRGELSAFFRSRSRLAG